MNDDCLKLTIYFGERDRAGGGFVADALCAIYARHELQTSLIMRGVEGFGAKHQLHTDRLLTLSEDLPLVSVAVDTRPRIEAALRDVERLRFSGLVTLERARMLTGRIEPLALPADLHEATKLTVYVGRQERSGSGRGRRTRRSSSCSTGTAWPARRCCSASTGRRTAGASGRGSSAATSACR